MAYFSVDEEAEDPEEGAWEVTFAGTQVRGCRGSRGGSVGGDVRGDAGTRMPRIQRRERGR